MSFWIVSNVIRPYQQLKAAFLRRNTFDGNNIIHVSASALSVHFRTKTGVHKLLKYVPTPAFQKSSMKPSHPLSAALDGHGISTISNIGYGVSMRARCSFKALVPTCATRWTAVFIAESSGTQHLSIDPIARVPRACPRHAHARTSYLSSHIAVCGSKERHDYTLSFDGLRAVQHITFETNFGVSVGDLVSHWQGSTRLLRK